MINFETSVTEPEFLSAITKPLTNKIIQVDKDVLTQIAKNLTFGNETLIKHFCEIKINSTYTIVEKLECGIYNLTSAPRILNVDDSAGVYINKNGCYPDEIELWL